MPKRKSRSPKASKKKTKFSMSLSPIPQSPISNSQHESEPDLEHEPDADVATPSDPNPSPISRKSAISKRGKKLRAAAEKYMAMGNQKLCQLKEKNIKMVPFTLNFTLSKHESLFRVLGIWEFAQLSLDKSINEDLIMQLIAFYDPHGRKSMVNGARITVSRADIARALSLPGKRKANDDLKEESFDCDVAASILSEFISSYMLFHLQEDDDACILPQEVLSATQLIKEGQVNKVDWAGLIWGFVEKELQQVFKSGVCYYASHLQQLIRFQQPKLLEPAQVETETVPVETEPVQVEIEPVQPETEPVPIETEPVPVETEPVQAENEPIPVENEPVQAENKPVPVENEPVQVENEPVPVENEPVQLENEPVQLENEPVQVENKPLPVENEPVQVENELVPAENEPVQESETEYSVDTTMEEKENENENEGEENKEDEHEGEEENAETTKTIEELMDIDEMGQDEDETGRDETRLNLGLGPDPINENEKEEFCKEDDELNWGLMQGKNEMKPCGSSGLLEFAHLDPKPVMMHSFERLNSSTDLLQAMENVNHLNNVNNMNPFDKGLSDPNLNIHNLDSGNFLSISGDNHAHDDDDDNNNPHGSFYFDDDNNNNNNININNNNNGKRPLSEINESDDDEDDDNDSDDDNIGTHLHPKRMRNYYNNNNNDNNNINNNNQNDSDFFAIMDKAKMQYMEKDQALMNSQLELQYASNIIQQKDEIITQLEKNQHKYQSELNRYEHELNVMARLVSGYKMALKKTRVSFSEYRKKFPEKESRVSSYYVDVPNGGGLVVSRSEMERIELERRVEMERIREERESEMREVAVKLVGEFEREWFQRFRNYGDRLVEIERRVEFVKEMTSLPLGVREEKTDLPLVGDGNGDEEEKTSLPLDDEEVLEEEEKTDLPLVEGNEDEDVMEEEEEEKTSLPMDEN